MKDSADIRKVNKDKIRRILWKGGEHTKQSLARDTGLSVATCNTLLNDMERCGEVIGEKRRLQEVGRSTAVYRINEAYESILCISFEIILGRKSLKRTVLTPLGNVLEYEKIYYETLDYPVIEENVSVAFKEYPNITRIMVGTPSIAGHGIIRHCDIPELEEEAVIDKLERRFSRPVYLENDMHFKVYGFYKKEGTDDKIVTLANFPSHVLPGTASIHQGTVIKGRNQLAGMVGFLPYDMELDKQIEMLERSTCLPLITKAAASIIVLINPDCIVFTGDLLDEGMVELVRKECLRTIPEEYMPAFSFQEDVNHYYLEGMYRKALDLKAPDRITYPSDK